VLVADTGSDYEILSVVKHDQYTADCTIALRHFATAQLDATETRSVSIPIGSGKPNHTAAQYCELPYHRRLICDAMMDVSVGADICLIGERGIGKTRLAYRIASALGYASSTVTMHLYKDMSARDLLQRRTTSSTGDTVWENTPLIHAATSGGIVVLDGIDRLAPSTLSILQRLCHDRELTLFDGTCLVRWDRYDYMLSRCSHAYLQYV
jgi:von Willebrand factor A domain-containing protein 8